MTIKFAGIARGATDYFIVNWSPGGSRYLRVSCYGSYSVLRSCSVVEPLNHVCKTCEKKMIYICIKLCYVVSYMYALEVRV